MRERKQTFNYSVDLLPDAQAETANDSKSLLPAAPGATYYLGSSSPDISKRSLYERNRDEESLRAGVVPKISGELEIKWFGTPPEGVVLDEPATGFSNDEVVYPKHGKTDIARANVATAEADAMIPDVLAPLLALIALAKLVLLCRISERITDAICRILETRPRRRRPRAPAPRKN